MTQSTIERLDQFFLKNPIAKGNPCLGKELEDAQNELNLKFDDDYIFFQLNYGGSMIKAQEIYGFHNCELMGDDTIIEMTKSYRENEDGNKEWLIIGTDYSGNSIGINNNGNVLFYDHDFGELNVIATSFEEYIIKALADD